MPGDNTNSNQLKTVAFLIAIETMDNIKPELIKLIVDEGLYDHNVDASIIDVGPLGDITIYNEDGSPKREEGL